MFSAWATLPYLFHQNTGHNSGRASGTRSWGCSPGDHALPSSVPRAGPARGHVPSPSRATVFIWNPRCSQKATFFLASLNKNTVTAFVFTCFVTESQGPLPLCYSQITIQGHKHTPPVLLLCGMDAHPHRPLQARIRAGRDNTRGPKQSHSSHGSSPPLP